jgi:hypothetical protein
MRLRYCCLLTCFLIGSCSSPEQKSETLARKYCSSCHEFPDPSLLDKKTWEKDVLPQMAFRMGLDMEDLWQLTEEDMKVVSTILPARPMVNDEEWLAIKNYFATKAPSTLEVLPQQKADELKRFSAEAYTLPSPYPSVTHITFDSSAQSFLVGTRQSMLFKLNAKCEIQSSTQLTSPVSFIDKTHNPWIMACMGIMDPNDQSRGQLHSLNPGSLEFGSVMDSLKRPVHLSSYDFNSDKRMDYLVSEFGNYTGKLTLYEQKQENKFVPHPIHYLPGTRKTILTDFDKDGVTDILALVTQGDEQIVVYRGHDNFNFTPETLLRFSPVWGSSYFDLIDFNGDNNLDILYTNGDNADYSQILKPYHGVRIFMNNGKGKFSEEVFLPMHGASMAIGKDFDGDSDIDIAAISFFPDFINSPSAGFIYFENIEGEFRPQQIIDAEAGRWLTITSADIDRDNDEDLILGSLNFTPGVPQAMARNWQQKNTSLLVLRNNLH